MERTERSEIHESHTRHTQFRMSNRYAAKAMISSSTEVSTFASSSSTFANTVSSIRYSLQRWHCATGRFLRMTIVRSVTLNGKSVVVLASVLPQTLHFIQFFSSFAGRLPIHSGLADTGNDSDIIAF